MGEQLVVLTPEAMDASGRCCELVEMHTSADDRERCCVLAGVLPLLPPAEEPIGYCGMGVVHSGEDWVSVEGRVCGLAELAGRATTAGLLGIEGGHCGAADRLTHVCD